MRLMRKGGMGKYSVVDNRSGKIITECGEHDRNEYFVLFLKDKYSQAALAAYAAAAANNGDREYSEDVADLVLRAGPSSPYCKDPD